MRCRPFYHQNTIKRLAVINRRENDIEASCWLSAPSENHILFAFMMSLSSGRLLECATS